MVMQLFRTSSKHTKRLKDDVHAWGKGEVHILKEYVNILLL